MVSESARTLELLRQRDQQKRKTQLWVGLVIVWGALVGWFAYLAVRAMTSDAGPLAAWAAYLVPLAILGGFAILHVTRRRGVEAQLLESTEADRRRG